VSATEVNVRPERPGAGDAVPLPVLVVFRGIGQIWFQEHALTGVLFVLGIGICFPVQAAGIVVGSAIGCALAWGLKYDRAEVLAGIYGFNPALVGIATLFFFEPSPISIGLLAAGCVVATLLTRAMRGYVPFPTYTAPFVVTTWGVYLLAVAMGGTLRDLSTPPLVPSIEIGFFSVATANSVGQVMFQASIWTAILFLAGIAIGNKEHAAFALAGAAVGVLVALYHFTLGADAIDPDRLIERSAFDVVKLGLYGFNATLAPVALFLWRRSLISPLVGMLLTVPLTELVPRLGVPALTAPFVLATWIVLALGYLEEKWFGRKAAAPA
jgi:urea transporter